MKFKSIVFLFGIALVVIGCSSTRLTLRELDPQLPEPAPVVREYATFWDAMENADLSFVKENTLDHDQTVFATALAHIMAGRMDSAIPLLDGLLESTEDSLVREHSGKILASILFTQSRWKELLDMPADPDDSEPDSGKVLVEAFHTGPVEEVVFPAQPVTLPIALSKTGSPIVEVVVNGHKKKFWLDTGAGLSVVASDVAESCGISPVGRGPIEVGTATTKKIEGGPAIIAELNIGGIIFRNHPALILNEDDLELKLLGFIRILKIDGIIGWNAIQNIAMEIDYRNKSLTMRQSVETSDTDRNFFWLGYPIIRLWTEDGTGLNFGMDTGARRSSIQDNIFGKVGGGNRNKKIMIGSAGGMERTDVKILDHLSLVFNRLLLKFEKIATQPADPGVFIKLDGVLGSDIAQNGTLMLDFRAGKARLESVVSSQ